MVKTGRESQADTDRSTLPAKCRIIVYSTVGRFLLFITDLVKHHGEPHGNGEPGVILGHVVPSRRNVRLHGVAVHVAGVSHPLQENFQSATRRHDLLSLPLSLSR